MKKVFLIGIISLFSAAGLPAQEKVLKMEEAVQLGLQNSKQLKVSQDKIDAAVSRVDQARDLSLPQVKVNAGFSEALMLTQTLNLPGQDGSAKPVELPFGNSLWQAGFGISQPIFNGNQFRYAREEAALLVNISKLDAEKDRDEITLQIIQAYINYYKIIQNQKVISQNREDILNKLDEVKKFEKEGLAIRNDVLIFELQLSNMDVLGTQMEANRNIANYSLNVMLGLPDSTQIKIPELNFKMVPGTNVNDYLQQAMINRKEFRIYQTKDKLAEVNIKKIEGLKQPTLSASGNLYYINPSKDFIPKSGSYLAPFLLGINVGWDVTGFFTNKHKASEAKIQRQEVADNRSQFVDDVKKDVYKAFQEYHSALTQISILETSILTATENERVTESRFHNSLATTTERIDAQTSLFRSRVALELAKADATIAYYNLMYQTGQLSQ